jgi:tRNA threonylcarbamoyladenosine biosynthesis protein TsaE
MLIVCIRFVDNMRKQDTLFTTYTSASLKETLSIGKQLVEAINPGTVVALSGSLGAGKTAFVKGIAKGLGIKAEITSPTFTIVSIYEGNIPLYHVDLYRIHELDELDDIGLEEIMYKDGITAIEWPEIADSLLPEYTIRVNIQIQKNGTRSIHIRG